LSYPQNTNEQRRVPRTFIVTSTPTRPIPSGKLLTSTIDGVLDKKAFNAEITQERADAAHNVAVREIVLRTLKEEISTTSS
jgi:hypothetical protein